MLELIDGRDIATIADRDLFTPLGITRWSWGKGTNGFFLPYVGLRMTPRDMLKLGNLMLQKGRWEGRAVVPAAWVDAVTAPRIPVPTKLFDLDGTGTQYGYTWWNGSTGDPDSGGRWYSTVGNGGQRIFVAPEKDLVVVMTAGEYGNSQIQAWETKLLRALLDALGPAKSLSD